MPEIPPCAPVEVLSAVSAVIPKLSRRDPGVLKLCSWDGARRGVHGTWKNRHDIYSSKPGIRDPLIEDWGVALKESFAETGLFLELAEITALPKCHGEEILESSGAAPFGLAPDFSIWHPIARDLEAAIDSGRVEEDAMLEIRAERRGDFLVFTGGIGHHRAGNHPPNDLDRVLAPAAAASLSVWMLQGEWWRGVDSASFHVRRRTGGSQHERLEILHRRALALGEAQA